MRNKWVFISFIFIVVSIYIKIIYSSARTYIPDYKNGGGYLKNNLPHNYFTPTALNFAKIYLENKIDKQASTIEKLRQIELVIYQAFGTKNKAINIAKADDIYGELFQFQIAYNQQYLADCGHYTKTLSLFLAALNIKSRVIGIENILDSNIGAHTYAEVFIPEIQKWIYTDMTLNVLYAVKNSHVDIAKREVFLNTQDLTNLVNNKLDYVVLINIDSNRHNNKIDSLNRYKNLASCFDKSSHIKYYTTNNTFYYANTLSKKLANYYFFKPPYYLLSINANNNLLYFVSTILAYLGIFCLGLFIFKALVQSKISNN